MSMRMCSLDNRVHGEHSRNTMLNITHCNSSHELDDKSKILRMVALAADTKTAARISQDKRLPSQVLSRSISRLSGNNHLRILSTLGPLWSGPSLQTALLLSPSEIGL